MPTCPRCALFAIVLAVAVFTGCDSNNPGRDLDLVDGIYTLEELTFDPTTQSLPTADLGASLSSGTTIEIFGGDGEAQMVVRYESGRPSSRIELEVGATRGRASFEAVTQEDIDDLADIFLPPQFVLTYDDEANVLSNSFTQTGVNLEAFDPDVYRDQRNNRGTLTIQFRRL
ncbi:hypothetical protein [Rubrivirga marina]|uniref:Lipocalin-like domain-containing protein n=1 Tax=Rubrivirga marina TaxID=1196024 RepID=A0A271IWD1_9BACT|nr:hypothetical protein [Rubrivirga marina]PAP75238.1 hypothetical protein BSZ37_01670 [Rubrivirga marina]